MTANGQRVFLMYHELEVVGRPLCHKEAGYRRYVIGEDDFRAQMHFLQRAGWRGVSVSDAFSSSPLNVVVITFDDGCETDLLTASPILKATEFNATFYVTVGFLGRSGFLSSAQLRELCDQGFDIGCHSWTHSYLTDIDRGGLHREIVDAKHHLEQLIGRSVDHFSCPGGRWDQRVVDLALSAGYRTVATSRARPNSKSTDPLALGRVAVMRETSLPAFDAICRGRGLWQLRALDTVRDTARILLGNSFYDRVRAALLRSH